MQNSFGNRTVRVGQNFTRQPDVAKERCKPTHYFFVSCRADRFALFLVRVNESAYMNVLLRQREGSREGESRFPRGICSPAKSSRMSASTFSFRRIDGRRKVCRRLSDLLHRWLRCGLHSRLNIRFLMPWKRKARSRRRFRVGSSMRCAASFTAR